MRGFSVVETIVVIAITMILLTGGVVSLAYLRTGNNLLVAADTVKIALEKSRLSALVREDGVGYNLKLNETDLVLFKGTNYNPAAADNKVIGLPPGIKIVAVNLSGGGSVVSFSSLTGTTTPGTVVLAAASDLSKTRTIYLEGSGRVFSSSGVSSEGSGSGSGGSAGASSNPTTDTGRQDFDLGWSIQKTSELKFRFLTDPPDTNIFIMEPHFNGDKSVFNYVGYFSAGGATQKIRIYSNRLDPSNTILAITREPNTVAVPLEISIDNRVIVTYLGDGTMSVGAFGGTVISQ